jgi:hypothetical protein
MRARADREAQRLAQARALVDLVRPNLPLTVRVSGPHDAWPLVGPAFVARIVGSAEALWHLHSLERQADAMVVLRTLFEHTVTFAWLAADPSEEQLKRFLKSDSVARLKADDDAIAVGQPLLSDEKRAEFEKQRDTLPKEMPDLAQRSVAADDYWSGKLPGLEHSDEPVSFRGLYALAYRHHSAVAHPSLMGLNRVSTDDPDGSVTIHLEQLDPSDHGPFGMGTVLLVLALMISARTLEWPTDAEIISAMDR